MPIGRIYVLLLLPLVSPLAGCGLPSCDAINSPPASMVATPVAAFTVLHSPASPPAPPAPPATLLPDQLHVGFDAASGEEAQAFLAFRLDPAVTPVAQVLTALEAFQEAVQGSPFGSGQALLVERLDDQAWSEFEAGLITAKDLTALAGVLLGALSNDSVLGPRLLTVDAYATEVQGVDSGDHVLLRLRLAFLFVPPPPGATTSRVTLAGPGSASPPVLHLEERREQSDFVLCY